MWSKLQMAVDSILLTAHASEHTTMFPNLPLELER